MILKTPPSIPKLHDISKQLTSIFREYFGYMQLVDVRFTGILEVLRWFDFLVVVQPDHVESFSAGNSAT